MKKLLLLSLLSALATSTFAASNCSISYVADDTLIPIIKANHFELDNYEVVCRSLKNANAKVNLMYQSFISPYQTTAVVMATVMDKNLPIESTFYSTSLRGNPERTTTIEKDLLMSAVNAALNGINQQYIESLNENRRKLGFKTYPASTNTNKK